MNNHLNRSNHARLESPLKLRRVFTVSTVLIAASSFLIISLVAILAYLIVS